MIVISEELCAKCGQCHMACPVDAIHGWTMPEINYDECTECLECIDWCPADAIGEK